MWKQDIKFYLTVAFVSSLTIFFSGGVQAQPYVNYSGNIAGADVACCAPNADIGCNVGCEVGCYNTCCTAGCGDCGCGVFGMVGEIVGVALTPVEWVASMLTDGIYTDCGCAPYPERTYCDPCDCCGNWVGGCNYCGGSGCNVCGGCYNTGSNGYGYGNTGYSSGEYANRYYRRNIQNTMQADQGYYEELPDEVIYSDMSSLGMNNQTRIPAGAARQAMNVSGTQNINVGNTIKPVRSNNTLASRYFRLPTFQENQMMVRPVEKTAMLNQSSMYHLNQSQMKYNPNQRQMTPYYNQMMMNNTPNLNTNPGETVVMMPNNQIVMNEAQVFQPIDNIVSPKREMAGNQAKTMPGSVVQVSAKESDQLVLPTLKEENRQTQEIKSVGYNQKTADTVMMPARNGSKNIVTGEVPFNQLQKQMAYGQRGNRVQYQKQSPEPFGHTFGK